MRSKPIVLNRVLLTLILLGVLYVMASGQGASLPAKSAILSGIVTNATGTPVPRPYITLERKQKTCRFQANSLGVFQIHVPAGSYNILVEADGFKRLITTDAVLQGGKDYQQKFSLEVGHCDDCYGLVAESGSPVIYEYDDPRIKAPVIIERPEPEYTEVAKIHNIQGKVVLRVLLDASGSVRKIVPIESLPYGLTDSAVKAARELRFQPAMFENRPVSSFFTLNYEFSRNNTECLLISKRNHSQ